MNFRVIAIVIAAVAIAAAVAIGVNASSDNSSKNAATTTTTLVGHGGSTTSTTTTTVAQPLGGPITVPNVVGLKVAQATKAIKAVQLVPVILIDWHGTTLAGTQHGIILYQSPAPGSQVFLNAKVQLGFIF
jgi:beta-lactam-binding protein with PASTA domain